MVFQDRRRDDRPEISITVLTVSDNVLGGFFELEEAPRSTTGGPSLFEFWTRGQGPFYCFGLARSALRQLLARIAPPRFWVPAYICASVSQQAPDSTLRFYPLEGDLEPNVSFLDARVQDGDVLLGVNYFGRPPGDAFRAFVADRPSVTFIEDCAQTIDTGLPPWGQWRLFSPRKLLGVPDGGLLVHIGAPDRPIHFDNSESPDNGALRAMKARRADPAGRNWADWHDSYETWRLSLKPSARAMSKTTLDILTTTPVAPMADRRTANFTRLSESLQEIAFGSPYDHDQLHFVPFGFPINLSPDLRTSIRRALWEARIYTFRHFADLPSPAADFPYEWGLSESLLTLPCDQRLTLDDIDRIVTVVQKTLRP